MKRTVSISIQLNPADFLPFFKESSAIFNSYVDWALENKTYNQSKAYSALYEQMKQQHPPIPTAFIQAVQDTAMEAMKVTSFKKRSRKKKYSRLRFDRRTVTLRREQLSLSSLGKRAKIILKVPDYFRPVFDFWTLKEATLTYSIKSERLVYEMGTPPRKTDGEDRGLQQLAATSEGQFFSNHEIRASQRRHLHNRKTTQSKGTPSILKIVNLSSMQKASEEQAVVIQPHVTIGNNLVTSLLPCAVGN